MVREKRRSIRMCWQDWRVELYAQSLKIGVDRLCLFVCLFVYSLVYLADQTHCCWEFPRPSPPSWLKARHPPTLKTPMPSGSINMNPRVKRPSVGTCSLYSMKLARIIAVGRFRITSLKLNTHGLASSGTSCIAGLYEVFFLSIPRPQSNSFPTGPIWYTFWSPMAQL